MKLMFDSLLYAHEIDAKCLVVHPGRISSSKDMFKDCWAMQIDSLAEIVEKAKQIGMDVNMEIMEPRTKEIVTTPEMANDILHAISMKNFGITLDLSHAQITGRPLEFIQKLKKSLTYISVTRKVTGPIVFWEKAIWILLGF